MPWEQRGNQTYYYRSKRVGGRVVKEYLGGGVLGMLAAETDEIEREQRADERAQLQAERDHWADLERSARELDDLADGLAAVELLTAGFHRHDRGTWRRRRDESERDGYGTA